MSLLCELISTNGHQVLCVSNPQFTTRELVISLRGYARRLCFTPVFSLIGAVAKIPGNQKAHARVCSGVPVREVNAGWVGVRSAQYYGLGYGAGVNGSLR